MRSGLSPRQIRPIRNPIRWRSGPNKLDDTNVPNQLKLKYKQLLHMCAIWMNGPIRDDVSVHTDVSIPLRGHLVWVL